VRAYRADPVHAFPGVEQQKPEAAEVTQLRLEVARLKMERDILKKAVFDSIGRAQDRAVLEPLLPRERQHIGLLAADDTHRHRQGLQIG
jgi:transposase-like protein